MAGLSFTLPYGASAQTVDTTLWSFSPSDRVLAIAPVGDTVYLGGSFLYVGPSTGGGVPVDARTAVPLPRYPRVVGRVYAVLADGLGGWFVGGDFLHVGNHARKHLAHIDPDGTVSAWAPNPDEPVRAMALSGSTLFVGGDFDSIGDQRRVRLAALSVNDDAALPWRCDTDGQVTALLASGPTVYVCGWFLNIGGQPRKYVAAVDAASGSTTPWRVDINSQAVSLALHDTTLFIGGYFWEVNGAPHQSIVAVGAGTAAVHAWDPGLERIPYRTADGGPHVNAMLVNGDSLFIGGSFSHIGGQLRRGLAQIDLNTALATSWNARATRVSTYGPEFLSLAQTGDTLFVSGAFDSLAGTPGKAGGNAAALNSSTAERHGWDPNANAIVSALALQQGVVFLGGWFTSVGDEWVQRRGLAAIDMTTGRVTDWDPQPNNYVKSLLVHGGKVYVGGYFSAVGGQPRAYIAALDAVTGQATPWNPGANRAVLALQPMRDAVLAGGLFTAIAGRAHRGLAAIDTSSGLASGWNPNTNGEVYAIALSDSAIYVGGFFQSMGAQPRASLAALDPVTALATPWNPRITDGIIEAIALLDGNIYVGGWFREAGGLPRNHLAAFDGNGSVTPWAPDVSGPTSPSTHIEALAAGDSTVYAGGFFAGVSGVPRDNLAAIDAKSGTVRTTFPTADGAVWSLVAAEDGVVYVGGAFNNMGPWPQVAFAAIRPARVPSPPEDRSLALIQCTPNPARSNATIRYTLPGSLSVSLTVFDLQGRTVARILSNALQMAGPQQVSLSTAGWRPGCYLYRLDAGRLSTTRKMVVLR